MSFLSPTPAGGKVYVSEDTGLTWTQHDPVGKTDVGWVSVDISGDGLTLVAAADEANYPGRLTIFTGELPIVGMGKITQQGYNEVIICDIRRVYHLHAGGEYTRLGPASVFTGGETDHFVMQEYVDKLYFVNGVDPIYVHTPNYTLPYVVPQMVTSPTAIQTCMLLLQFKERLLIIGPKIGGVWYPNYLYYTDVLLDTVQLTNFVKAPGDITPITAGYIGDTPVIFCLDGSIWHIDFTNNTDAPFKWTRRQRYHGGRAKMATVEVNNKLHTMGLTRMITYDGYEAKDFDERIRGFYQTLNDQKILWTYAHRFLDRNYLGYAYTRGGQTTHDRILMFNIDDDNFYDSDIVANSLFSLKGPWLPKGTTPGNFHFPIRDQDFEELELAGGRTGKILQINTGYQDEGENFLTDKRTAQLNPFQKDGFRCSLQHIKVLMSGPSGEGVTLSFFKNDSQSSFKTVKLNSSGITKNWQTANVDSEVGDFFTIELVNHYEDGVSASSEFLEFAYLLGFKRAEKIRNRSEYSV